MLIKWLRNAWCSDKDILFIILQVHCTCFGCQPHPSSGVHKTDYSLRYCGQVRTWPRWREVAAQKIWPVPAAVVTVLCTHDGCGWHPKHVEWTDRIINRLFCVASRCTIINIDKNLKKLHIRLVKVAIIRLKMKKGKSVLLLIRGPR